VDQEAADRPVVGLATTDVQLDAVIAVGRRYSRHPKRYDGRGVMSDRVRRIAPDERTAGLATPGMVREEAIATDRMWAGLVRTDAGMMSGWHHHGGYQTAIFVLSGALRMEFGPGGRETLEATPGDFVYVEPGGVHRESNPSDEESRIVVVRAGDGQPVFNVDGPEPASA
jgi:uncharacterized RmlC-like cupin family protein